MPTLSRAHQAADVHGRAINESRKRVGLAPLSAPELTSEFADADRAPFRKAVAPRATSNTGAADSMWGGIVGRLNASLPSHHPPVGSSAERGALPSPAAGSVKPTQRAVDWGSISAKLNTEAGLTPPARR